MTLGRAPSQVEAFRTTRSLCEERLSDRSVYRFLHNNAHVLFPDDAFAELFHHRGRQSVPPRIVATVMVLQRIEGLSDREAVDRFQFDARWKYAAGGLDFEYPGFVHTVLVDMRERLRRSARPDRIFEAVLEVARAAGFVGNKRVLDSTALYDAVATQDTITMVRASIRGLLRVVDDDLGHEIRGVLLRDDDYVNPGKPACDWDDKAAREALVDALARDAYAVLALLHDRTLSSAVKQAAELVATVVGQDIEEMEGRFRIIHGVAPDRVISTVDPQARHGHKTSARGFDGYKGHVAIDPDSEIITATTVTAGNVADGAVAMDLLRAELAKSATAASAPVMQTPTEMEAPTEESATAEPMTVEPMTVEPMTAEPASVTVEPMTAEPASEPTMRTETVETVTSPDVAGTTNVEKEPANPTPTQRIEVYGDAAYGTGENLAKLKNLVILNLKVALPVAREGQYSKQDFLVDLEKDTVTCPAGNLVQIGRLKDGSGIASFGRACTSCSHRDACTKSKNGRTIQVNKHEGLLQAARAEQATPEWQARYRSTRPKVERKQAHMMRRRHGGRRARMRGRERVEQDFSLLAAATNVQRLARLLS